MRHRLRYQMYAVGVICASILAGALVAWLVTPAAHSGDKHDGGVKSQLAPSEVTRPVLRDGTPLLIPSPIHHTVQPSATRRVTVAATPTPHRTGPVTVTPSHSPPSVTPSTLAPSSTTPATITPTPTPTTPPPTTTVSPPPATAGATPTA